MGHELSKDDLRRYARLGAMKRLEEIRREEAAIRRSFPELFAGRGRTEPAPAAGATTAKPRSSMTAAMRKEVSLRMKKYWAARRKAKNG